MDSHSVPWFAKACCGGLWTVVHAAEIHTGKTIAAWLFAAGCSRRKNQAQWVESTGLLPLRTSLLDMVGPYRAAFPQWDAAGERSLPGARRTATSLLAQGPLRARRWMTVIFQTNIPVDQLSSVLAEMDAMAEELSK